METNPDHIQWTISVVRDATLRRTGAFGAKDEIFIFRVQGNVDDGGGNSTGLAYWTRACKLIALEHDLKKWQQDPSYFEFKPNVDYYGSTVVSRGFPALIRLESPEQKVLSETRYYDLANEIDNKYSLYLPATPTETKET